MRGDLVIDIICLVGATGVYVSRWWYRHNLYKDIERRAEGVPDSRESPYGTFPINPQPLVRYADLPIMPRYDSFSRARERVAKAMALREDSTMFLQWNGNNPITQSWLERWRR